MMREYIEITPEDCKEGIKLSFKKITNLIDSADCLLRNNHYDSSIVFSIYALEEISRCKCLLRHLSKHSNIKKEEWREIFIKHTPKLNRIIREIYPDKNNKLIKGSYQYDGKLNDFLKKLNLNGKRIEDFSDSLLCKKERILYTDWINGKWESIEKYYNTETMNILCNDLITENKRLQGEIKKDTIKYLK